MTGIMEKNGNTKRRNRYYLSGLIEESSIKDSSNIDLKDKRDIMRSSLLGILSMIDSNYPYDYDGIVRYKNRLMERSDCRGHFLFCIGKYESENDTTLDNGFVNALWNIIYDRFYDAMGDNIELVKEYVVNITNPNSSKSGKELEEFLLLHNNFKSIEI
jgi:hypothetical protein